MKSTRTEEQIHEMYDEYISERISLSEVGRRHSLTPSGVWLMFRRSGLETRTPLQAGPIHGPKRSGRNHFSYGKPSRLKSTLYKQVRVIDADGRQHKRRLHVIIMERVIGRRLLPHECVHHIDGNRHNNDLSNLQLMSRSEHTKHEILLARKRYPEHFAMRRDPVTGRLLPGKHKK